MTRGLEEEDKLSATAADTHVLDCETQSKGNYYMFARSYVASCGFMWLHVAS